MCCRSPDPVRSTTPSRNPPMPVSEAQLVANRNNGHMSIGPVTPEGKSVSCRNGFKHGLSGKGIVVPEEVRAEIDRRIEAYTAHMKPMTLAGVFLVAQMAKLSAREDRCFQHESFAIAHNV